MHTNNEPFLGIHIRDEKFILFSLLLSTFSTWSPIVLTGLLLIDIGLTFESSVGIIGQIHSLSSIITVISALVMGVLSIRFRHKSLLLMGLFSLVLSALGSGLAPSFDTMLISYSLSGLGMAMVIPTAFSLIGDLFPLEKRPGAIGWIIAGMSLSAVMGAPVINFIADITGWRMAFLGFVLPIALLSLLLAARGLPSTSMSHQSIISRGSYVGGFKVIFSNKSAAACLVGDALSMASLQANILYGVSFFRQRFLLSVGFATIHLMMSNSCYTLGSISGGRLVNKFGRKQSTILSHLLLGVFIVSFTNMSNIWMSMVLAWLGGLSAGISYSALSSLTLEQVPRFRGTMMSLFSAVRSLGAALGAGIGGLMLVLYDYGLLGISLGAMSIIAAIIFYFLTIDPTRTYS